MMTFQWLSISIIFIVLSLVQIDALGYPRVRQATNGNCTFPDNFCQFVECINGQCLEDKTTSDCYKCQCTVGFTGKLCDTPIVTPTGCGSGCQNGGRCEQTAANTSICICPPNFTGSQCETSTVANHICVINPASVCQNGGTCTTNGADYLCNCPAEWTGVNCQTKNQITSCNQNPCGAHGTCIEAMLPSGSVVFCNCENQWTGKYCDVNQAVNCSNGFCQSGGTCQMNGNIPVCICPPTHAGQQCETLISTMTTTTTTITTFTTTSFSTISPVPGSCSSSPCLNGASCFNTGNSFICLCTPQWTGLTCNVQNSITTPVPTTASGVNPCTSNPCNNGGSCLKHSTGFICVCTSQYTGPTCALVRTTTATVPTSSSITCANQPCQNGAACYNAGSSYFCYCGTNSNFTGKNCETSISLTSPPAQQSDCPLNCAPGYCVRSGGNQYAYACMCNGILTPTSCSP